MWTGRAIEKRRYLIVARDHAAAKQFAQAQGYQSWLYVGWPVKLDGLYFWTVVYAPGCEKNRHYDEIKCKIDGAICGGFVREIK